MATTSNRPSYRASSPWFNTPQSSNGMYLDVWVPRNIQAYDTDRQWIITAHYETRPDLLAHDLYGDHMLWWVFQMRNLDVLNDPINDFKSGTEIYLPQLETLKTVLGI